MIKSCHKLDLEAIQKHEMYSERGKELSRLCRLSFDEKLRKTMEIIDKALITHTKPIVACSFGKDSVAVLHMVHKFDDRVPAVFTDTGVEFPETREYIKELERVSMR